MDKVYRPAECMKYMNCEMHPSLLQSWYLADLNREMTSVGATVTPAADLFDPNLVMWMRNVQQHLTSNGGQLALSSPYEDCKPALYINSAEEVSNYVGTRTLTSHIKEIQEMVEKDLTLVVYNTKDYFKTTSRKTANSNRKLMTEVELELAKTDLLVSVGVDTVIVNTPNELALLIVHYTKAIAEAPYKLSKRESDQQAEFYMRGDNKNCLALDNDGQGVSRVWQQMVSILPQSSLGVARAICAQYKTPKEMFEAMKEPDSVNKLADIGVSRAAAQESRARRVGPEFARKLHALFTAEDGNTLLE